MSLLCNEMTTGNGRLGFKVSNPSRLDLIFKFMVLENISHKDLYFRRIVAAYNSLPVHYDGKTLGPSSNSPNLKRLYISVQTVCYFVIG